VSLVLFLAVRDVRCVIVCRQEALHRYGTTRRQMPLHWWCQIHEQFEARRLWGIFFACSRGAAPGFPVIAARRADWLRSAPMQVAQQFLAALARDWDSPLDALKDHLDQHARGSA